MTQQKVTVGADADEVVLSADPDEVATGGATVAFMRGRLKAEGGSGAVLDALRSGAADAAFAAAGD